MAFYQLCPVQKGNPVISFHVDFANGFLLTGLASGAVDAWPLPPELGGRESGRESGRDPARAHEVSRSSGSRKRDKYSRYYCRRLIEADYESVRHVHVKRNHKIVSVVGDRYLREWASYSARSSQLKDFQVHCEAQHSHSEHCKYAQVVAHANSMLLYRKHGLRQLLHVNLDLLNEQRPVALERPLARDEFLMSFDGARFITKSVDAELGAKLISLFALSQAKNKQAARVVAKWVLPRSKKEYWGFQLNAHPRARDRVVYVSNQNVLKCYSLAHAKVTRRLKGHSNYIVAFHHLPQLVVSIGTDRCVRIWDVADANAADAAAGATDAKCIYIRRKVPGHFVPGYLYKIAMHRNIVFYTADDGIFAFKWEPAKSPK